MKSKTISVLILSITLILVSFILVSCKYDGSPTQNTSDLETLRLSKPNKPNPNKPELNSENITFTGDLVGSQEVIGCCGNAGPFPEYTMNLSVKFPPEMRGEHDGHIFMNFFGAGKNKQSYLVQFWWTEGVNDYFIEIIGGDIERDRKTKSLTVTFVDVPCKIWINDLPKEPVTVSFNLTRAQMYY